MPQRFPLNARISVKCSKQPDRPRPVFLLPCPSIVNHAKPHDPRAFLATLQVGPVPTQRARSPEALVPRRQRAIRSEVSLATRGPQVRDLLARRAGLVVDVQLTQHPCECIGRRGREIKMGER